MGGFRTLEIITVFFFLGGALILIAAAPFRQRRGGNDVTEPKTYETEGDQRAYLQRFGHMKWKGNSSAAEMRSAIRRFQRYGRLRETGIMDNATKALMKRPRCGLSDDSASNGARRRRRYTVLGPRWPKNELKIRIEMFSAKLSPDVQSRTIMQAFQLWADVVPLIFKQTFKSSEADINVRFASYDHGDGFPFDGPGGVYAHTFPPTDGRVHFDESETWTVGTKYGVDLRQVSAHEVGHSLGLGHSENPDAVMNPIYPGPKDVIKLEPDDIAGAQRIYGNPPSPPPAQADSKSSSSSTSSITSSTTTTPLTTFRVQQNQRSTPLPALMRTTPPVRRLTPPKYK